METERATPPDRINPFIFLSTTTFRFVLLVAAALSASVFAYNSLYNDVRQDQAFAVFARCTSEAELATADPVPGADLVLGADFGEIADEAARGDAYDACVAGERQVEALFSIAGMLIVAAGAVSLYWFLPGVRIRRRGLEPIHRDDAH